MPQFDPICWFRQSIWSLQFPSDRIQTKFCYLRSRWRDWTKHGSSDDCLWLNFDFNSDFWFLNLAHTIQEFDSRSPASQIPSIAHCVKFNRKGACFWNFLLAQWMSQRLLPTPQRLCPKFRSLLFRSIGSTWSINDHILTKIFKIYEPVMKPSQAQRLRELSLPPIKLSD